MKWSSELAFLPPDIPIEIMPLLKNYVNYQTSFFEDDAELQSLKQEVLDFTEGDTSALRGKLEGYNQMCARQFSSTGEDLRTQRHHLFVHLGHCLLRIQSTDNLI